MSWNPIDDIVNTGKKIGSAVSDSFNPKKFGNFVDSIYKKGIGVWNDIKGSGLLDYGGDLVNTASQVAASKYGYDKTYQGVQDTNKMNAAIAREVNKTNIDLMASSNQANITNAREANAMAQANAREQMAFQAQQSATAHQREVADLKAAGLNPILSGTGGMGASSGSGASGAVIAPQNRAAEARGYTAQNAAGAAVSSAMDVLRTVAQTMKTNADRDFVRDVQTPATQAATRRTDAETRNLEATNTQINESTNKIITERENLEKTGRLTDAQITKVKEETENIKKQFDILKRDALIKDIEYDAIEKAYKKFQEDYHFLPEFLDRVQSISSQLYKDIKS